MITYNNIVNMISVYVNIWCLNLVQKNLTLISLSK